MRINVVGSAGSGKTTLADRLAHLLGCRHVEIDALYWQDDWQAAALQTFRDRVRGALDEECWVADGNYSAVRDIVWERVEMVVWLDYPLAVNLWRLTIRSVSRALTRRVLWQTNNRESFLRMFGRDSLYVWTVQTHARRRATYRRLSAAPEYAHIHFIHLNSPAAARRWLEDYARTAG